MIDEEILDTVLALALTFVAAGNAVANKAKGGFQGPSMASTSVAEALKMSDDTPVVLKGKIEKSLGGENTSLTTARALLWLKLTMTSGTAWLLNRKTPLSSAVKSIKI